MKVIQLSPPRTGSTVIYQMLATLPGGVEKAHDWEDRFAGHPIVATMRDPRDMCASMWRIERDLSPEAIEAGRVMTRAEMIGAMNYARIVARNFMPLWVGSDVQVLWLRYERFWDDLEHAMDAIEQYINPELQGGCVDYAQAVARLPKRFDRDLVRSEMSLDRNRERAAQFGSYKDYDEDTQIHGMHCGFSAPGSWEKCVLPMFRPFYRRAIMRQFEEWEGL